MPLVDGKPGRDGVHLELTADEACTGEYIYCASCVIHFMMLVIDREAPMWIVEVNFAGRRFTHRSACSADRCSDFSPRSFGWRPSQLRDPRAA